MRAKPRGRTPLHEEDATSQAGWLFADSFLALMVVFLATISFIPVLGGGFSGNANIKVGEIGGTNLSQGLVFAYEKFDAARLQSDYYVMLAKQKYQPSTTVLYVNIVGGFNAKSESANQGVVRALAYSIALRKAALPEFAQTRIDLSSDSTLKPNQILMRVTLSS
jgi:hypothetical protein